MDFFYGFLHHPSTGDMLFSVWFRGLFSLCVAEVSTKIYLLTYFYCMCISFAYIYMYVHHTCAWCPQKPEEATEALDYLELELQTAANHHGDTGNRTWVLYKSSQCS